MKVFVDDLKYAQTTNMCVNVTTYAGEAIKFVGVLEVNENEGFVTLQDPQHFGDITSNRKLALDAIAGVEVTDVEA